MAAFTECHLERENSWLPEVSKLKLNLYTFRCWCNACRKYLVLSASPDQCTWVTAPPSQILPTGWGEHQTWVYQYWFLVLVTL